MLKVGPFPAQLLVHFPQDLRKVKLFSPPGETDPPGSHGLHLVISLHPPPHPHLLHHRAGLDLPGWTLLRLHLPHHDRTGWLHPRRPPRHGTIPDFLQNLRRPLSPLRPRSDLPHSHRLLRHSPAKSGTSPPPTQVTKPPQPPIPFTWNIGVSLCLELCLSFS